MAYLLVVLFALAIGSFLNVVIYRLPLIIEENWRQDCASLSKKSKTSLKSALWLWYPRSFCPSCKKQLSIYSNIPILSFCLQRGKCTHCQAPISYQYPLVEALSTVLSVYAAFHFGFNLQLVAALIFVWLAIPLFFIDIKHHLLPDDLTLGLLWIGLIVNSQQYFCSLSEAVYGAASGYLILWVLVKIFYLVTGKVGMGHGDFKLFAALGAWFGWLMLPLMLLFASIMGVVIGVVYLKATHQSKDTPIPFGPFLCLTGVLTLFWGFDALIWYINHPII